MQLTSIATTNSRGQIVIPVAMRRRLGIAADTSILISLEADVISLTPLQQKYKPFDYDAFKKALSAYEGKSLWNQSDDAWFKKLKQRERKAAKLARKVW